MRIAYVNADHGIPVHGDKGASVHIAEMVHAFAAIGCDVHLLAARVSGPAPAGWPGTIETVPPAMLPERGADRGDKERRYAAIADAIEERLVALHAERPFDVIYERYALWSAAGVRAGRRLGIPVILEMNAPLVEEQGAYRKLELAGLAREIEAENLRGADGIAAVSAGVADYATRHGARPDSVHVIGNAIDTARFNPRVLPDRTAVPSGSFVIGFTGSLKHWHGIDLLLEAFREVRAGIPSAHLLIVGDGPKRGWVEGFLAGAGLTDAATLTGWVDHQSLPGLIAGMDVATAPYPQSDNFYFSPLKLYEYMGVGCPVVASRIGQIETVLEHEVSGLLTTPGDAEELADAIRRIHAKPVLATRLANAAAERGARHSWRGNAEAVLGIAECIRAAA